GPEHDTDPAVAALPSPQLMLAVYVSLSLQATLFGSRCTALIEGMMLSASVKCATTWSSTRLPSPAVMGSPAVRRIFEVVAPTLRLAIATTAAEAAAAIATRVSQ